MEDCAREFAHARGSDRFFKKRRAKRAREPASPRIDCHHQRSPHRRATAPCRPPLAHARPAPRIMNCLRCAQRRDVSILTSDFRPSFDAGFEAVLKKQTPALGCGARVSQTTKCRIGDFHGRGGFAPGRKRNVKKGSGRTAERWRDESRHRNRVRRIESDDVIPNETVALAGIFIESSARLHFKDDTLR